MNKKIQIILITLLTIYSLVGFFIIPYIVKSKAIETLDNLLIYKTSIKNVIFNPYTLMFEIEDFALSDEKEKKISFKKFYIDFSLLNSIHEKHINFKALKLVNPYVVATLNENGVLDLSKILKPIDKKEEVTPTESETTSIPNFKIKKIEILDGNFIFNQIFKGEATTLNINRFNHTLYNFGTFENALASHSLETYINKNTKLYIDGGMRLIPFKIYGNLKLENLNANEFKRFSKDLLNFDISDSKTSLNFGFRVDTTKNLEVFVDKANLNILNFNILQKSKKIAGFDEFKISNVNYGLTTNSLNISNISLNNLYSNVASSKKGEINLTSLVNIPNSKEKTKEVEQNANQTPLTLKLDNLTLNGIKIDFDDMQNSQKLNINPLDINLKGLNLSEKIDVENLKVNLENLTLKNSHDIKAKNIAINLDNINFSNKSLKIGKIDLNKPYIDIALNKTNESKQTTKEEKQESKEKSDFKLDIGGVKISNATFKFTDKNLPIPFKTTVSSLNGNISSLNSNSSKPTELKVEGKVDRYGYTRITGLVDHKDIKNLTDINMIFKNIAIENFTPYSGKFVGRKLDGGKLNLNLKYNIKKSNLDASNSIIITDIKLGEVIESPDAMSLPLELGIALLEDSDGVIDLDIPITGDLNDPQFSIAPIVWKALTNLIVKAVSAPFSLLASLLGIGENEINSVEYIYGESKLIDSEKEVLDKIAKAFAKRPSIALKITPSFDKPQDTKALQYLKIETLLKEDMAKIKDEDRYLVALENRYLALKEKTKLEELKKTYTKKDKDKKDIFDKDSYVKYLKEKVVKTIEISDIELKTLAKNRVKSIIDYLDKAHGIKQGRIIVKDEIKVLDEKNAKYAKFDLEIDIKKK